MEFLKRSFVLALSIAIAGPGCVFEDRCVNGAVRGAGGRCVLEGNDAGRDAGMVFEAGPEPDGGMDAGMMDGGMDAGPPIIEDFSVGAAHACVVTSEGELRCWGANQLGALATGDVAPVAAPRTIDLGAPVVRVAGNTLTVCAETTEPALYCWAGNEHGQVGNGMTSTSPVTTPFRIDSLGAARDLAGSFANVCFVGLLGGAVCWGRDDDGQLGDGMIAMPPESTMPAGPVVRNAALNPFEGAGAISVADRHTCIVDSDNQLYCFGRNQDGALGISDTSSHPIPQLVPGMDNVTSISTSTSHSCAVNGGQVYCWGDNQQGEVDPMNPMTVVGAPRLVTGVGPARQVTTGAGFTCALLNTGQVTCWGIREHGSLGDGMPVSSTISGPVIVMGLSNVERIEASYLTLICALTTDNELFCWGEDSVSVIGGAPPGAHTVFLDDETLHTAPVLVDPFAP